jgi:uncharacterized protein (TIRG00374 family)
VEAQKRRYIASILRVAIAGFVIAAGVYLLARSGQDWQKFWTILKGLKPAVIASAILLFFLSQVIIALRWYMLLRLQGIEIGSWPAIKLTFVGLFYNNILPSSMGGDAIRAWYVTKHTPKRLEAVFAVFVDRVVGLVGLVLMAVIAYFASPHDGMRKFMQDNIRAGSLHSGVFAWINNHVLAISLFLGALLTCAVLLALIKSSREYLGSKIKKAIDFFWNVFKRSFGATRAYLYRPFSMLFVLFMTFLCQAVWILGCFLIGRNLGIEVSFTYYLVFFPIGWVIGALPVSPGGAVIVESGLVVLFVRIAHVPIEAALALALCQRAVILAGSLPGAFVHMVGAHAPREFSIDYELSTK